MKTQNEVEDPNQGADARYSLLTHYSSKSTNQTTILVGLAVALFADIQAYSVFSFFPEWFRILFLTSSIGVITYFVIRQTGRLIIWGELASAILDVAMLDVKSTEKLLEIELKNLYPERKSAPSKSDPPKEVKLVPTYLVRLSCGTYNYVVERKEESKQWHMRFYSLISHRRFALIYFILLSIVSILLCIWSGLFLHS